MDVSKNGLFIVTGSNDKTAKLWSLDRTFPVRVFVGHMSDVTVRYKCNINIYITIFGNDSSYKIVIIRLGKDQVLYYRVSYCCQCVKFHPNEAYMASGGADRSVRLWAVCDARLVRVLCGHRAAVRALAFAPAGTHLASAGQQTNTLYPLHIDLNDLKSD